MFKISLTAESVEEMKTKIQALSSLLLLEAAGSNPVSPTIQVQPIAIDKAKRGRKPAADTSIKTDNQAPAAPQAEPPAVAPSPAPIEKTSSPVGKEVVTKLLQEVNVKKGLPKAREVLAQFNCQRLSEIKETDYGAFVGACRAALEG